MSQILTEMQAAAWPDRVHHWYAWNDLDHPLSESALDDVDWVLGDPLPRVVATTRQRQWIVPATDGEVWWWVCVPSLPTGISVCSDESGDVS